MLACGWLLRFVLAGLLILSVAIVLRSQIDFDGHAFDGAVGLVADFDGRLPLLFDSLVRYVEGVAILVVGGGAVH